MYSLRALWVCATLGICASVPGVRIASGCSSSIREVAVVHSERQRTERVTPVDSLCAVGVRAALSICASVPCVRITSRGGG